MYGSSAELRICSIVGAEVSRRSPASKICHLPADVFFSHHGAIGCGCRPTLVVAHAQCVRSRLGRCPGCVRHGTRVPCVLQILVRAGASNVMLVTLLIPVSALLLGHVFLDEPIQAKEVVGALVIGAGLLFIDGRLIDRIRGVRQAS